ncbi:MAG: glutamate 5-kinase [endosymbiont of Galathealinum brachiosum]|uniref:Glutamate 5-kinase n=1 Tax=endosymbiont of Galathealinum brachiosum TaxID=2200906 RepID=A0A370DE48_9GAMM|nr:MAG: glutamate 5-kinase [endosymbiont of Galathealinum brachiosum]
MKTRQQLANSKRWVIKIGSSLVTDDGRGLDAAAIKSWTEQITQLRQQGKEILLVSSGAVAEGMVRLNWDNRPKALHNLQAAAAVGQMGLVQTYESCFQQHGILSAQILLTHDDLSDRRRYLNARSTLRSLLDLGVIPIINENDTVATDEIRFGDNDTLAALVANLVEADALIILTDQQGLYSEDPRKNPDAKFVSTGQANDASLHKMASSSGGSLGQGGMSTKLSAAQRAARSGTSTLITSGRNADALLAVARGEENGTLLLPDAEPMAARKQWLAGHLKVSGQLTLDEGASKVLLSSGKSLLAVGVTSVNGNFIRGEMVSCISHDGREIAHGLANYNAIEAAKICGKSSDEIEGILGYVDEAELIHRDNLVLI